MLRKCLNPRYFISDNGLVYKVGREDDKLFHVLVVPLTLSKYVLHQVHDALGHNGTGRTYPCLKLLYYWKGLHKDVDIQTMYSVQTIESAPSVLCKITLRSTLNAHTIHCGKLIGKFQPSPHVQPYDLTIIDMLTNYTGCILLFTKKQMKKCIPT